MRDRLNRLKALFAEASRPGERTRYDLSRLSDFELREIRDVGRRAKELGKPLFETLNDDEVFRVKEILSKALITEVKL